MEGQELIKLPITLGAMVHQILRKKIGFQPRKDKMGLMTFEYTREELALIEKLEFVNPLGNALVGIDLLPNLKSLRIKSTNNTAYTEQSDVCSITNKDGFLISKCKNLEVLEIENQPDLNWLDVSNLRKLRGLKVYSNKNLELIDGLDQIKTLWDFNCVGNEMLSGIKSLDKIILQNPELDYIQLDLLLFPDAIGYKRDGTFNEEALKRIEEMNSATWEEEFHYGENITIKTPAMKSMHQKAIEALKAYVPDYCETQTAIIGIEQFLSENVAYDNAALKNGHTHSYETTNTKIRIAEGPKHGANGAFNAFMWHSCVCAGFTRAMQYMLRLKGINSHYVRCISGKDRIQKSEDRRGQRTFVILPEDGYHSIIRIDDFDYLYDDPCWNATAYRGGDHSLPWTLLTKKEIEEDHTLSFEEKHINNNSYPISRQVIADALQRIAYHRSSKFQEEQDQAQL